MNRFFIEPAEINNSTTFITGNDAGHILRVLRLAIGDKIELCDGTGMDYLGEIVEIGKECLKVKLGEGNPSLGEPTLKVTIFQALPKGSKMDLIIQKTVELGANTIVPLKTVRTEVNYSDQKRLDKKVARWQKISQEAAKQSRRGIIPIVKKPIDFDELLKTFSFSAKLLLWEGKNAMGIKGYLENLSHKSWANDNKDMGLVIGPEGGFDNNEVELARRNGWDIISMGSRILRTETAGLAALAAIMSYMGEME
ncbi:MAG: 16S rRNA (uracil(1498)-N(3))-methyltransferase [Clostridiales bacterium]|nr:16S rRNA (uracil(1498)-N(3))-methyltransferase [Clostridiales bacterium]